MILVALSVGLIVPSAGSAQVSGDGPPLVGIASPAGLSVFIVDTSPGSGLGGMIQWRQDRGSSMVAYRAGLAEDGAEELSVFGGVDIAGVLARGLEDTDIDVLWWAGVGAGVGGELAVSVPLGIVVGWQGLGDRSAFAPYVGAHTSLDIETGPGDAMALTTSLDLGLDLSLSGGGVVRFAASMGGRDAVALGFRLPRGGRSQQ